MASVDAVHARVKICMCVFLCTMLKRQSTLVKRSLFRLTGRDGASERAADSVWGHNDYM